MYFKRNVPLIVSPYSNLDPGGIGTWTKIMIDYSESENRNSDYNVLIYSNQLKRITNTKSFARITTGFILYSKLVFQVLSILRKYHPSVLHITSSASISLIKDLILIQLSRILKIPVIIHWRFGRIPDLTLQNNWEWKMLCNIIQKCYVSIVIDKKSYNTLQKYGFKNVMNIPNPVGLLFEQESKNLISVPYNRVQGRILFVGHVIRTKGVIELVKACSQLPLVKELLLVGPYEKDFKEELLKLACLRENGIWLKLTGDLSEDRVLEQMLNSPILALPSYTEGFPNVVLEAMAMGCAVIATDVGAIPEMLATTSQSPCGVCVPVRDAQKLGETIVALVNDPLRTRVMGKNGIERVLNNYTTENVIQQYVSVWESAASGLSLFA